MKQLLVTVFFGLALVACGGDDDNASSNAASGTATGTGGSGGGSSASGSGGGGGAGGGSAGPCTAGNICLDVKRLSGPVVPGRLAVMWYQLDNNPPFPTPSIAYDVPFDPTVTRVTIPIADLSIPGQELLFCDRPCADENMCFCQADPQVGFGIIVIANDTDMSDSIEPTEAFGYYGMGWVMLGYSEKAFAAPVAAPFDMFVDGIEQGIRPYKVLPGSGSVNTLGNAQDGDVFDLNACPGPGSGCTAPIPNLG